MADRDFRVKNGLHVSSNAFIANSITNVNSIQFNTAANATQAIGSLDWSFQDSTLEIGLNSQVTLQIGQETLIRGTNATGNTIPNGTLVMISSAQGSGGDLNITPSVADGSVASKNIIGLTTQSITNGTTGFITTLGKVRGLDTSNFAVGDELYANPTVVGGLSNTKPVAPNVKVQIGTVLASDATNGVILVRPNYGSAIEEDENVFIVNPTNKQALTWSSANSRFENYTFALTDLGIVDGTPGQVLTTDGAGLFNFQTVSGSGSPTNAFTSFIATSGSTTASNTNDALTIVGSNGISTSITGDTLTITMPTNALVSNVIGDTGSNVRSSTDTSLRIVGGANTTTSVSGNTVTVTSTQAITETLASVLARGNSAPTHSIVINNLTGENATFGGNVEIDGNLTVSGSTITVSATSFAVTDNMLYLNQGVLATITNAVGNGTHVVYTANNNYTANMAVAVFGVNPSSFNISNGTISSATPTTFTVPSTVTATYVANGSARGKSSANPDLGFAAGYNDGTYHHTGLFRDATDGNWKFFENYAPEPDASVFIDTSNSTFRLANVQANNFIGNVSSIANHSINALGDVVITTPSEAQILKYIGTSWVNAQEIDSVGLLVDVDLGSNPLSTNDTLVYNGTVWVNTPDISSTVLDYLEKVTPALNRQSNANSIVSISVGTTAPSSPAIGDLWVDTN